MKISDLIATLEALKQQYGDLPVFCVDPDDGPFEFSHELKYKHAVKYPDRELPERIEFQGWW